MISLTKTQLKCLKEVASYNGYPSHWMTKTREKLFEMGLVRDMNADKRFSPASFVLTDEGRNYLKALGETK